MFTSIKQLFVRKANATANKLSRRPRSLQIETLENRQLMAVVISPAMVSPAPVIATVNTMPTALVGSPVAGGLTTNPGSGTGTGGGISIGAIVTSPVVTSPVVSSPLVSGPVVPVTGPGSGTGTGGGMGVALVTSPVVTTPSYTTPIYTVPQGPATAPSTSTGTIITSPVVATPIYTAPMPNTPVVVTTTVPSQIMTEYPKQLDNGPISAYYRSLPNAATLLGNPTMSGDVVAGDGVTRMRIYERGAIVSSPTTGTVEMTGGIYAKWQSLGGLNNPTIGNPVTSAMTVSGNDIGQSFQFGMIMTRPQLGSTFEMHGEIFKRWLQDMSKVGLPRSDETNTADGLGRQNQFDSGAIRWDRATNTTSIVIGSFLQTSNTNAQIDPKFLFLTGVASLPQTSAGKPIVLIGATNDLYTQMGREKGALGATVTGERLNASKLVYVTQFQYGAIYRTMQGTFEVHGDIYKKYAQTGGENGPLGLPKTNETSTINGDGRFNTFENGAIFWTLSRGAYEVHGEIFKLWASRGYERGSFGYPTSDEHSMAAGDFQNSTFQYGAISWSGPTGTIALQGQLWQQWQTYGAENGFLGAPIAPAQDVWVLAGVIPVMAQRMQFQGGTLTVRPAGPAAVDFSFGQMKFALQQIARDGTTVSQGEMNQMRSFLNAPNSMPDYVRNLLDKLVNGDRANLTYRQTVLGNLQANDQNWKLVNLIDKWFGGGERPRAVDANGVAYQYRLADGVLFGPNGPRMLDIDQGLIGDCCLQAALSSLTGKNPQLIRDMFIDNGDGTYCVRFFNQGKAEYVTVDLYFPTDTARQLVYSNDGRSATLAADKIATSPLWCALAEKAYVIVGSSGWAPSGGTNDYGVAFQKNGINGGSTAQIFSVLANVQPVVQGLIIGTVTTSGVAVDQAKTMAFINQIKTEMQRQENWNTVVSTPKAIASSKLVSDHAYVLLTADKDGMTLFNPWGLSSGPNAVFRLTWAEAAGNLDGWYHY